MTAPKYIRYMSDLHIEKSPYDVVPLPEDAETVLVLAGDIWDDIRFAKKPAWLADLASRFYHVIIVLGNHDYWGHSIDIAVARARWLIQQESLLNVDILDNNVVRLPGLRFLGATLWTDCWMDPLHVFNAAQVMNDYKYIRDQRFERRLRPEVVVQRSLETRRFITAELDVVPTDGTRTIVVTHHAPVQTFLRTNRCDSALPYYVNRLEHLMDGSKVQLWIHGHTHENYLEVLGGVRLATNARGYSRLTNSAIPTFNPLQRIAVADLTNLE